jgi:hypothetical protein
LGVGLGACLAIHRNPRRETLLSLLSEVPSFHSPLFLFGTYHNRLKGSPALQPPLLLRDDGCKLHLFPSFASVSPSLLCLSLSLSTYLYRFLTQRTDNGNLPPSQQEAYKGNIHLQTGAVITVTSVHGSAQFPTVHSHSPGHVSCNTWTKCGNP